MQKAELKRASSGGREAAREFSGFEFALVRL